MIKFADCIANLSSSCLVEPPSPPPQQSSVFRRTHGERSNDYDIQKHDYPSSPSPLQSPFCMFTGICRSEIQDGYPNQPCDGIRFRWYVYPSPRLVRLLRRECIAKIQDKVVDFCSGGCTDFGRTVTMQHYHPDFVLPPSASSQDGKKERRNHGRAHDSTTVHPTDLARVVSSFVLGSETATREKKHHHPIPVHR